MTQVFLIRFCCPPQSPEAARNHQLPVSKVFGEAPAKAGGRSSLGGLSEMLQAKVGGSPAESFAASEKGIGWDEVC